MALRYPNEILEDYTDWFSIRAYEYVASGSVKVGISTEKTKSNLFGSGINYEKPIGSVILPMPSNIQDGNSVDYGEDKLYTITGAAVGAIAGITGEFDIFNKQTSVENAKDQINKAISDFGLTAKTASQLLNKTLAAEAVGIFGGNVTVDQLLARENGEIFNPNMELLFSGPTLRTFRFSFKMTPRDDDESENIKEIIRFLKKNMAPQGGQGQLFLKTPNVFDLSYRKGGEKHPFLHSFKPCFLTDMAVNYTGENTYVTYSDGTPISMVMDLTFKEMFPIYNDDYGDNGIGVGY